MAETSPSPGFFSQVEKIVNYVKRTRGSGFLFYSCDTSGGIVQINRAIIEKAAAGGITIAEFFLSLDDTDFGNLLKKTREIARNKPGGIIIANIDESVAYSEDRVIKAINNARDILLEFNIPFLLGMTRENISKFANQAQDLFLRRDRGVVRFTGVPVIPVPTEPFDATKTMTDLKPGLFRELPPGIELLENQLINAEAKKLDARQIANDIALELLQLYLESSLIEKARSVFYKYKPYFNLEDHLKSIEAAANFYYLTAQWDQAIELYLKSKKIRRDMGDNEGLFAVLVDLGRVYEDKNDLPGAIACFTESRELIEKQDNQEKLARVLSKLGGLEFKREQWDKALYYLLKGQELFEKSGDLLNQNIAREKIKQIKERLEERKPAFPSDEAQTIIHQEEFPGRDPEQLFKVINMFFSPLTPEAQEGVLVFAPFTSFINTVELGEYLKALQRGGDFVHSTLTGLEEVLARIEGRGLLKEVYPKCYAIPPVFSLFLGEQVKRSFSDVKQAALDQAFCLYMTRLAENYIKLMASKEPGERQMGFEMFRQDRENLDQALHRVLDKEGDFYSLYKVFGFFYYQQPLYQEAIEFMTGVVGKLDRYAQKDTDFLVHYAVVVGNLGTYYIQIKNFSEAKKKLTRALELLQQAGKRKQTAAAYHQLGIVAEEERDFSEAKANYREALKIEQEFHDRYSQARTFHQLGYVAQEERDWESAKANYREALKICQEFNDRYNQARIYQGLGIVAAEEKEYVLSLGYFATALEIYTQYKNNYWRENTLKNLSRLLQTNEPAWEPLAAIEELEVNEEMKEILRNIEGEKVRR